MNKILYLTYFLLTIKSADLYDVMKSNVINLTKSNFGKIISKNTQSNKISLTHFYNEMDDSNNDFKTTYEEKSKVYKGIFTFTAVNCSKNKDICNKEVTSIPSVKLYLPNPLPSQMYTIDKLSQLLGYAASLVKGATSVITNDELKKTIMSNELLPKVFFFSKKKDVPLVIRSLSDNFKNKIEFFFVNESEKDITNYFKISEFPKLIILRPNEKKPNVYSGKLNYGDLFDYLNIYSEQFVPTDVDNSKANKPWLIEDIPEFTKESSSDICLSSDRTLCVIVFLENGLNKELEQELKQVAKKYDNNNNTGYIYKFMFINFEKQAAWRDYFNVNTGSYIVLNPGRRKRYLLGNNYSNIENDIQKISNGDARFSPFKNNQIPTIN